MTHVAKEGNPRKGVMNGAEISQSVLDVESWFKKHGGDCLDHAQGADDGDLQALEKAVDASVPKELRSLLSVQDGDLWFSDKQALTCKAMATEALEMEGRVPGWRPGLIPFAKEFDGTFLVADAQTRGCPVAEWDLDGEGAIVADTFSLFLERFRNDLLSGRCEFVEGIGIVEKMKTSARAAAATGRGRGK
eukprot:jgi/Undpi1/5934/HiC_scaffold_2.g01208.m1